MFNLFGALVSLSLSFSPPSCGSPCQLPKIIIIVFGFEAFCCCLPRSDTKAGLFLKEDHRPLLLAPLGHWESQNPSPRDVAFSPADWKDSFKTRFGFIFQRPGLGIPRTGGRGLVWKIWGSSEKKGGS